jgi:hypothetical protein
MKNKLSYLTLGFVGIFALLPGCGDDEGTGDDEEATCTDDRQCREPRVCSNIDDPNSIQDGYCYPGDVCHCEGVTDGTGGGDTGGAGGKGGTTGKGGTGGATLGGSGGKGGTAGTGSGAITALGEACSSDAQCGGLTCLLPDGLPSGDGPPNGLCTQLCESDDQCLELAGSAYCVGFEETAPMQTLSYCILGCVGGMRGAPKCGTRDDFACGILATSPTTQACVDTNDCTIDQVCFADIEGDPPVCQDMLTACRPLCRADSDCAAGQFCDFASGFCSATEPTGFPIGALCDPTLPAEEDECNGFCLATDETNTEGTCAAFCSAGLQGYGCGWVGDGAADAACLFATIISRDGAGGISLAESDLMLCGGLCDCNEDCPAEVDLCMDENKADPTASIQTLFGRPGYCRPLIEANGETEADSFACAQASK